MLLFFGMLNPRVDSEEIELESLEKHLQELEKEKLDEEGCGKKLNVASLKRYSGALADYMDSEYEDAKTGNAVKSNILYNWEDLKEDIGGNRRIIGSILTELNVYYNDVVIHDEPFRWDVGLIPEITDQLRKVDGQEMPFENEADEIREIIKQYQPIRGPEILDKFEEKTDYSITYNQFMKRTEALNEEGLLSTDEGYALESSIRLTES